MQNSGMNEKAVPKGMELRLDSALLGILTKLPPSLSSVVLRGVTYTPQDLKAKAESLVAPYKEARAAHTFLRQFAQTKPDYFKAGQQFLADLKAALSAHLGRENEELTHFGFSPLRRPRDLTVEEKALRTAKGKLTRGMRGTLGKRQREEIKAEGTPTVEIGPDQKLEIVEPDTNDSTNNPNP